MRPTFKSVSRGECCVGTTQTCVVWKQHKPVLCGHKTSLCCVDTRHTCVVRTQDRPPFSNKLGWLWSVASGGSGFWKMVPHFEFWWFGNFFGTLQVGNSGGSRLRLVRILKKDIFFIVCSRVKDSYKISLILIFPISSKSYISPIFSRFLGKFPNVIEIYKT